MSVRRVLPVAVATAALLATVGVAPVLAGGPIGDVAVTKTETPDPVVTGQPLTYTVTVTYEGSGSASPIMTDTLPADAAFVSATPSQGTCIYTGVLIHTVSCSLGSVANNGSATVTIIVTAGPPGTMNNTAAANDPQVIEVNPANNSDTESTTVVAGPSADLAITKTDAPDPVVTGQAITYSLSARNNGPDPVGGVRVEDLLASSGATFVSASASQGTCTYFSVGNFVSCAVGTMASGAVVTATVTVTSGAPGTSTNTAEIEADAPAWTDAVPGNNSATTQTTVVAATPPPSAATPSPSTAATAAPLAGLLPDTTATGSADPPAGALLAALVLAGAGLFGAWASAARRATRSR